MAYGFIDSDKRNDLVTINDDKNAFIVHLWDRRPGANGFESSRQWTRVDPDSSESKILSIQISRDEGKL